MEDDFLALASGEYSVRIGQVGADGTHPFPLQLGQHSRIAPQRGYVGLLAVQTSGQGLPQETGCTGHQHFHASFL